MLKRNHCTASDLSFWERPVAATVGCLLLSTLIGPPSNAAEVDAAKVQIAIDAGISYLRKSQNDWGGWNEHAGQSCGKSALCTLALLNAGVSRDDPDIVSAMKYLRSGQAHETYSVALQTLVFCQLGAAEDRPRIHRNVKWLFDHQILSGRSDQIGSWSYGSRFRSRGDPSNTQFAVLALGAAYDQGVEVPPRAFARSLKYWNGIIRDGGYSYNSGMNSGSMTCAGIASTIIARGQLGRGSSQITGDKLQCCGGGQSESDSVEQGLAWLARHFSVQVNPGAGDSHFYYYLYALERVGRLTGRRFIGDHDWYREGAQRLLELQNGLQGYFEDQQDKEVATSFALLFLSKGKRQVVISRLKYPVGQSSAAWQQHPDALRQLTRHVEYAWRRDLTWQTIDMGGASLQDLLQTPVLMISGSEPLLLDQDSSDRLKAYIDQGGCILFEADAGVGCGDASGFEESVRRMTKSWFPDSKLDRLPPDHPIWSAERTVDPTLIADDFWVYGVQACCRTAVFYVPQSLSCRWEQSGLLFQREKLSQSIRAQVDGAVGVGQNLVAYATGRELKDKLESRLVIDGSDLPEPTRNSIQLAALAIDAGAKDARRALPNAATLISARLELSISAAPNPVGFDPEQLQDVSFLWVHGRADFALTDFQTQVLRQFIDNGGVIIGASVCGDPEFSEAFRREMARVTPGSTLQIIPPDHPLMTVPYGYDIRQITIRNPASGAKQIDRQRGSPQLEMSINDNLPAIFFSPLDLSCALESPSSVPCAGYSTEDAAKILANLILFSLQQ